MTAQNTAATSPPSPPAADADLVLLQRIITDVKSGKLRLPSLPDVAHKIRATVSDPRRSSADIARVVQFDPALAARLIQIANSPLYRGTKKFDNCHSAVTRIGLGAVRNLVTGLALHSLFEARTPLLRQRLQQTWQHSCRVAAISSVLARLTQGLDPDRALLAGLIHDIGVLPLLRYIEAEGGGGDALDAARLDGLIDRLRAALGSFVLKTWRFEPELAAIPAQAEDLHRDSGPRADYGDVVLVAHVHSQFGHGGYAGPPLPELKAFQKLSVSRLGPGCSLELLNQSQQEISEVLHILQG
jgi:HD-like signal output (HDOD) protein